MFNALKKKLTNSPRPDRPKTFDIYVASAPSLQNAVDALPGWRMSFPAALGVVAGPLPSDDARIAWAIERHGALEGRKVLEIAPHEAAHSAMLEAAGARVEAIERNRAAYMRCLVAKEILRLTRSRYWLGDVLDHLDKTNEVYDLVVACDALRLVDEPARLIELASRRADALFLWTPIADGAPRGAPLLPNRDALLAAVQTAGFRAIETAEHAHGDGASPALSIFARK
jgi:hypothetical protein